MISIDPKLSLIPTSSSTTNSTSSCQEIIINQAPFSSVPRNITACVDPTTFGIGCDSHWTQVFDDPKANAKLTDWYDEQWCFVDPLECQDVTTYDANILDHEGVALSYATCSNVGSYQFETMFEHLRGETIRIAYPPVRASNVHLSTDPKNRDGVVVRFFKQVLFDPLELNVVEVNVTTESLNRFGNPFISCAHDVAIGAIDLCPFAMHRSAERLLFSDFTFVYSYTKMFLVIDKADHDGNADDTGFWHWVWTPLSPFTWEAWMAILLACLYMELARRIVQKKLEGKRLRNPAKEIGAASFSAVVSITAGGEVFIPDRTSFGEKLMVAGFAIFAWIFMSAYTAAFTFSLISDAEFNAVESLKDIVKQGEKICAVEGIEDLMLERYSFLGEDDFTIFDEYSEVFDELNDGKCKAGIVSQIAYDLERAEDEEFCTNKMQVGDVLLEIPKASPVSAKFARVLNYMIYQAIEDDLYQKLYDEYKEIYHGPPICDDSRRRLLPDVDDRNRHLVTSSSSSSSSSSSGGTTAQKTVDGDDNDNDNDDDSSGLTIAHMILPLLTTLICTTLGLLSFLFSNYREEILNNLDKSLLSREDHSRWQEKEIRSEISRMPHSELLKVLLDDRDKIPQAVLEEATNKLPDRGPLEKLVFEQRKQDSQFREKFSAMQNLSLAQIYQTLIDSDDSDVVNQANEALGSLRPKRELIDIAMLQPNFVIPQKWTGTKSGGLDRPLWKGNSEIGDMKGRQNEQWPAETMMSGMMPADGSHYEVGQGQNDKIRREV